MGYGMRDEALIQRVPKRSLQGSGDIKKGMQFQARTDDGMRLFTVTADRSATWSRSTATIRWPTRRLHFDVQIVERPRRATAEELEHGHVHGAGGHHH